MKTDGEGVSDTGIREDFLEAVMITLDLKGRGEGRALTVQGTAWAKA